MPRASRQSRADFHPMSATGYAPTRAIRPSGVPGKSGAGTVIIQSTRIITPRGLYASEKNNLDKPDSRTNVIVEILKYAGGDRLTAGMWIMHNGVRYDIVGLNDASGDYRSDTVRYQCSIDNNIELP